MRCGICDKPLAKDEVKENPGVRGHFEPCGTCLEVIKDVFEPDPENEVTEQLSLEFGEDLALVEESS